MGSRDGPLLAVSAERLGRVAVLEWKITPKDDSTEAQAQAEFLKTFIEAIPEFSERLEHLAEAIKYSIAGCEIEWLPGDQLRCRMWPVNHEDWDLAKGRTRLYF